MAAGAAGAAQAAAIANAIKASGAVVAVEPEDFVVILERQKEALVVQASGKWLFKMRYQYLSSYKGLAFYTKSPFPLPLPATCEIIQAKQIWIPG